MRKLRAFLIRLRGLFRFQSTNNDLEDEIASHIELRVADYIRAGMSEAEAHRRTAIELGGAEQVVQHMREQQTLPRIESIFLDLRFAFRQMWNHPSFALVSVTVYAVSLGAALALFAFVDAALIQPLPYKQPQRLMMATESTAVSSVANLSWLDYQDWQRSNHVFQSFAVWHNTGFLYQHDGVVSAVKGVAISSEFFRTLGIQPVLGHDLNPSDNVVGAPRTALLSYALWTKDFGESPNVIGKTVRLSDEPYTIVGVLPRNFTFAPSGDVGFWTALQPRPSCEMQRSCHDLTGVARLKPLVTAAQAKAEIESIARNLQLQYPESNRGQGGVVLPLSEAIVGVIRPLLLTLLIGACLLLVVAVINISSLLLTRSEGRRREFAVRIAMGTTSYRLLRQFVIEAIVLVFSGSLVGLAIAYGGIRLLLSLLSSEALEQYPFLASVSIQTHVIVGMLAIACCSTLLFTVMPLLRLPAADLRSALVDATAGSGSRRWTRFGVKMVVAELAMSVILLFCAGLITKSLYRLSHVELGFEPQQLATIYIEEPRLKYTTDAAKLGLWRVLKQRLESLPGVNSVAMANLLPVSGQSDTAWIRFVGRPYDGQHNEAATLLVDDGYFQTLRAHLRKGRFFSPSDGPNSPPVAIINKRFADTYFSGQDPIGKQIGDASLSPASLREIVGVVDDVRQGSLDSASTPMLYYSFHQNPDLYFYVILRVRSGVDQMFPELVQAIHEVDPELATSEEGTMEQKIYNSESAYIHRSAAWIIGIFASVALLLSSVGLYGVIANSVAQRTREIGVRIALGADKSMVYQLIIKQASWLALGGILIGISTSILLGFAMRNLLFGVRAWDLSTALSVGIVLYSCVLLASFTPARRAASVDPVKALRSE